MLQEKGKVLGLNEEIPNLKRETSKTVEVARQKEAEDQVKQQ